MFRAFAAFAVLVCATPASAGVFTDDLSRCLVSKASDGDQHILMKWLFSAFSLDVTLAPLANITPAQRTQITKDAAKVYDRLLVVDCRAEAVAALKNDGADAIGPSFGALGQSTAHRIFSSPEASAELEKLGQAFDKDALKKLFGDAGISMKDE